MKPEQNNPVLLSPSVPAGILSQPNESPKNLANQAPPIDPEGRLDVRILDSLRRIIRAMEIHSRMLLSTHQITVHQLVCLLRIKENGPLTETALARMVQLSSSTVVGILTRLEEKGLAKRERSTVDRRIINVTATAKGRRLVQRVPIPLQDGLAQALDTLPELERVTIALSLERIVELMEAGPSHGAAEQKSRGRKNTPKKERQ